MQSADGREWGVSYAVVWVDFYRDYFFFFEKYSNFFELFALGVVYISEIVF